MNFLKLLSAGLFLMLNTLTYGQYYTGQKVFVNRFPPEIVDLTQDTYIEIKNAEGDIIVAVENINTNTVIQHAYIKSNDTFNFKNIPIGTYVCKYMWTDNLGKHRYVKDDANMVFKYNEVGGFQIIMQKSVSGNLSQTGISENEFFN